MEAKLSIGEWPTFKSVLDSLDDLVFVKGDRSKLLWANRAFLNYYGMSNDELLDLIDAPHSDPDDTVLYVRDDHHVYTTGESVQVIEPITDGSGSVAYFDTVKSAVLTDSGEVYATVGVSRRTKNDAAVDVTEQARSIQKSSNQALRALVSNLPVAVAMLDAKRRILCHSGEWLALFGPPAVPAIGQFYETWLGEILPLGEELDQVFDAQTSSKLAGVPIAIQEGLEIVADIEIHPWFLPTEEPGGTIILVRDITELMRSERTLAQLNDELLQFNYRVSHDLVGPLRIIRGYLGICQEEAGQDPDLVRELQGKMIDRVDQLSELIQNILKLAQSEVLESRSDDVNLETLIEELLAAHDDEIIQAEVVMELDLRTPQFQANDTRIRQILENLLSNSLKFGDPSEAKHVIKISSQVDGQNVRIDFEDNGVGFADEVGGSAFDIFVRGHSNRSGSGLGLYLVKKHAQQLGGTVGIASPAKPTAVQLSVPIEGAGR